MKGIALIGMAGLALIIGNAHPGYAPRTAEPHGLFVDQNKTAYAHADENSKEYRRWEIANAHFASDTATIVTMDKLRKQFARPESAEFRNVRWLGSVMIGEVRGLTPLGVMSGWRHFEIDG